MAESHRAMSSSCTLSAIIAIGGKVYRISLPAEELRGIHQQGGTRENELGAEAIPLSVAGSIIPEDPPLSHALSSWSADMRRRGCKPRSITRFVGIVNEVAAASGWRTVGEVSIEGAVKFLAEQRDSKRWSGPTHDQACSALRGFGAYIAGARMVMLDPLKSLESSGEISGQGSRAMTTEEVRALVAAALEWERRDRKVKAPLALYWTFLALTGLRGAEAAAVRWKDIIDLDSERPTLLTDPAWSKNKLRLPVPLAPELVALLRQHRKSQSAGPELPLFPTRPNHHTWSKAMNMAGISVRDSRHRDATPHSLRKWLATELDRLGAPPGIASMVLRHFSGITDKHYIDRLESEAAQWVAKLPKLWPDGGKPVDNPPAPSKNDNNGLTRPKPFAEDVASSAATRSPVEPNIRAREWAFSGSKKRLVADLLEAQARMAGLMAALLRECSDDDPEPQRPPRSPNHPE